MKTSPVSCRHSLILILLAVSVLAPFTGLSQNDAAALARAENKELAQLSVEPARVRLFNWTIAVLRVTVFGHTPTERAKVVERRILDMIEQGRTDRIESRLTAEGTVITMDGEVIMLIAPGDVDEVAKDTMEITVARAKRAIETSLEKIRKQRDVKHNLKAAGFALVGLFFYAICLLVMLRFQRWFRPIVDGWEQQFGDRLQKLGAFAHSHRFYIFTVMNKLFCWAYIAICTYVMLAFALKQFPYTQPWGDKLGSYIFSGVSTLAEKVIDAAPNIFIVIIIFIVAQWISKIAKTFFGEVEQGHIALSWMDADAARPTRKITSGIIWIFAVVMAYPYIPGSNTDAFKGIGVFLGLLISLGASSMVGQVIGGMVLMYSRAMKIGEIVQTGEYYGKVVEIGFFSTKIQTMKNEEINIPNSVLMGSITKNYSRLARSQGLIVHTTITIGYDAPWRQVHALLLQAAEKTEGLRKDPAPFVLQCSLSDFYVEYELNAFLENPEKTMRIKTELHSRSCLPTSSRSPRRRSMFPRRSGRRAVRGCKVSGVGCQRNFQHPTINLKRYELNV